MTTDRWPNRGSTVIHKFIVISTEVVEQMYWLGLPHQAVICIVIWVIISRKRKVELRYFRIDVNVDSTSDFYTFPASLLTLACQL